MSDYTPITEEVRWQFSTDSPSEFMPEQFDLWLAEVKAQVWEEGYTAGEGDGHTGITIEVNPYRQGEAQ